MRFLLFVVALVVFNPATAATITEVDGTVTMIEELDINGMSFDVSFHEGVSFNSLFDPDENGTLDTTPYFWGDMAGASAATTAVIAALGGDKRTTALHNPGGYLTSADVFFVPVAENDVRTTTIDAYGEGDWQTFSDYTYFLTGNQSISKSIGINGFGSRYVYATFETSVVPVPAAAWLFASALFGLGLIKRRVA